MDFTTREAFCSPTFLSAPRTVRKARVPSREVALALDTNSCQTCLQDPLRDCTLSRNPLRKACTRSLPFGLRTRLTRFARRARACSLNRLLRLLPLYTSNEGMGTMRFLRKRRLVHHTGRPRLLKRYPRAHGTGRSARAGHGRMKARSSIASISVNHLLFTMDINLVEMKSS